MSGTGKFMVAPFCKCGANDWAKQITGVTQVDGKCYDELAMRCVKCCREIHFTHESDADVPGFSIHKPQPDELLW